MKYLLAFALLAAVAVASTAGARALTPPSNTSPPTISGTATQGQTLTALSGSWSGTTPISYSYLWMRCDSSGSNCSPISGQTSNSYHLVSADVGHRTQATVTATNQYGSTKASSNLSDVMVAKGLGPASTSPPVVSGSAQVGQKLTLSQGSWSGSTPMSFSYGWQRCDSNGNNCAAISAATKATYTVASADLGHRLRGFVRASNSFGASTATSVPTAVVTQGLPPGAIRLPNGTISVPVDGVSLPDLLVIDHVSFSPSLLRSRAPFTGQFR